MSKKKKRKIFQKNEPPKQRRVSKKEIEEATYRDVDILKKFVSDRGKIRPTQITGITRQEQLKIARLVKIARELALLPYVSTSNYKAPYNRR